MTNGPLETIQITEPDIYPFWNYSIRVKATNNVGTGDYSEKLFVRTKEKGKTKKLQITFYMQILTNKHNLDKNNLQDIKFGLMSQ